jgi:hypothetical protein
MQKSSIKIDSFTLKVIAIVGMTLNHIGNAYWIHLSTAARFLLIIPGGLTFPIMAYLITVGYQHTRDVKKYILRLAVFAVISFLPFYWVLGHSFNVLFTLLMGLIVLWADDHLKNRFLFWSIFVAAIVASHWCDWSYIGVPMILLYHRGRDKPWQVFYPIVLVWCLGLSYIFQIINASGSLNYWLAYLPYILYCLVGATATIPLLYNYSGERGRSMKYFFYAYYPLHIALLGLVKGLLFGTWL